MKIPPKPRHKYVVDGMYLPSVHNAYEKAVERGFDGSESIIARRLAHGVDTWEELARPVNALRASSSREATTRRLAIARHSVSKAVAALDARKREIAQRQREEDEKEEDNDG